ncbi:MAG: alpha/beta fold hydrolase [Treponema sp.]|nr:alpha/beta fold hydrolase [Treponema sp.]
MKDTAQTQIIRGAEPFYFAGEKNAPGVLLIHGFTGTPKEMRWMGEYLNRTEGFSCLGPRLAGHATNLDDMIRSTHRDWMASVEEAYYLLRDRTNTIYLAGLSMGAALALLFGSILPVQGVIAMASPYALPDDWRLKYTKILSKFQPLMPKEHADPERGWFDKEAAWDHICYSHNPLRSIGELNLLLGKLRDALPRLSVPTLLIYSKDDNALPLGSEFCLESIYGALGSPKKEKILLSGSGHVLTRDAQRQEVFRRAAEFIKKNTIL